MQDTTPPVSLSTILSGLAAIASLVGIPVTNLITVLLMRRQNAANLHKTDAETGKTEAETRQIDSSLLFKAFERLDVLENMNHKQGMDITRLEQECANTKWELSLSHQREKIHLGELDLANAELKVLRGRSQC